MRKFKVLETIGGKGLLKYDPCKNQYDNFVLMHGYHRPVFMEGEEVSEDDPRIPEEHRDTWIEFALSKKIVEEEPRSRSWDGIFGSDIRYQMPIDKPVLPQFMFPNGKVWFTEDSNLTDKSWLFRSGHIPKHLLDAAEKKGIENLEINSNMPVNQFKENWDDASTLLYVASVREPDVSGCGNGEWFAIYEAEDGKLIAFQERYILYLERHLPFFELVGSPENPAGIVSNNKIIGLLMPTGLGDIIEKLEKAEKPIDTILNAFDD